MHANVTTLDAGAAGSIELDDAIYGLEPRQDILHRMVRFLVGAMVDVALGRRPVTDMTRLLEAPDNQDASPPAPPEGLYLLEVRYPEHVFDGARA